MAEFKVTIEGKEYFVNGPEGASQVEAESFARQSLKPGRQPDLPGLPPMRLNLEGEDARRARAISQTARETGYPEALAVSAGRTANQGIAGVQQVSNFLNRDTEAQKNLAADQASEKQIYGGLQKEMPITTGIGEALPYLAVPASAGTLGGAAIVGGLEAAQYGTPSERGVNAATGSASMGVGGMLGRAVGKIFSPAVAGYTNQTRGAALDAARDIGYRPALHEITGSPLAARIADVTSRVPGGAGVMQRHNLANQQAVNRAAAKSIGETSNELGPPTFAAAADRLGKVFEDIKALGPVQVGGRQVLPIQIDRNVGAVADDILRQQAKMIPSQRDQNLITLAQQAKTGAQNNMRIDGETYQLTRSGLSTASFDATGTTKTHYRNLLNALDDAAEASLRQIGRGELADALRTARPQYANLKVLEKGTTAEGGNVSPARVASTLRSDNPSAFREGRMSGNPLYGVAQIGENLKPLQAGSPSVERAAMDPLSLLLYSGPSWLGAQSVTNPLINSYAQFASNSPTMGMLGRGSVPLVRAGIMGLLQAPGGLLSPVVPKN